MDSNIEQYKEKQIQLQNQVLELCAEKRILESKIGVLNECLSLEKVKKKISDLENKQKILNTLENMVCKLKTDIEPLTYLKQVLQRQLMVSTLSNDNFQIENREDLESSQLTINSGCAIETLDSLSEDSSEESIVVLSDYDVVSDEDVSSSSDQPTVNKVCYEEAVVMASSVHSLSIKLPNDESVKPVQSVQSALEDISKSMSTSSLSERSLKTYAVVNKQDVLNSVVNDEADSKYDLEKNIPSTCINQELFFNKLEAIPGARKDNTTPRVNLESKTCMSDDHLGNHQFKSKYNSMTKSMDHSKTNLPTNPVSSGDTPMYELLIKSFLNTERSKELKKFDKTRTNSEVSEEMTKSDDSMEQNKKRLPTNPVSSGNIPMYELLIKSFLNTESPKVLKKFDKSLTNSEVFDDYKFDYIQSNLTVLKGLCGIEDFVNVCNDVDSNKKIKTEASLLNSKDSDVLKESDKPKIETEVQVEVELDDVQNIKSSNQTESKQLDKIKNHANVCNDLNSNKKEALLMITEGSDLLKGSDQSIIDTEVFDENKLDDKQNNELCNQTVLEKSGEIKNSDNICKDIDSIKKNETEVFLLKTDGNDTIKGSDQLKIESEVLVEVNLEYDNLPNKTVQNELDEIKSIENNCNNVDCNQKNETKLSLSNTANSDDIKESDKSKIITEAFVEVELDKVQNNKLCYQIELKDDEDFYNEIQTKSSTLKTESSSISDELNHSSIMNANSSLDINDKMFTQSGSTHQINSLSLNPDLLKGIHEHGHEDLTTLQLKYIFYCNNGYDIVLHSQPCVGKSTACFISVLQNINTSLNECQAIVLVSTKELALLAQKMILSLGKFLNVSTCVSGIDVPHKILPVPHVIISTLRGLCDMINCNSLCKDFIKMLVIDDADEMFKNRGVFNQIRQVLLFLDNNRQLIVVSTTKLEEIEDQFSDAMKNPMYLILPDEKPPLSSLSQYFIDISEEWKFDVVYELFDVLNLSNTVIYCNTWGKSREIVEKMHRQQPKVKAVNNDMRTEIRQVLLQQFRCGIISVLVTNGFLRGEDFSEVEWVINYDLPKSAKEYVRKIISGFGRNIKVINLITTDDIKIKNDIETAFNIHMLYLSKKVTDLCV